MVDQPATAVLMFMAHRDVESRVMAMLAREGFDDITIAQSRLMQRLDPAGIRLTELAEQARVTKQTAGALVDQPVSYTHLTLPTMSLVCRSRWSPYH